MNRNRSSQLLLASALALAATLSVAAAEPAASNLTAVLAQMDASSQSFHSAEATVKKEQYERLVHDTSTQTGNIYYLRTGNAVQTGAKYDPPSAQILEYKNGTLRLYSPDTNHLETHTASAADQTRYQSYLALGFGGSGADLAKAWTIADQGSETVDGVKVEKLDLVSKDPGVRNNFAHITIWVDPARDITLKQQFFDPAGNTNTVTYSNIRYNQPIKDLGSYAIKCKGACS